MEPEGRGSGSVLQNSLALLNPDEIIGVDVSTMRLEANCALYALGRSRRSLLMSEVAGWLTL